MTSLFTFHPAHRSLSAAVSSDGATLDEKATIYDPPNCSRIIFIENILDCVSDYRRRVL